MQKKVMILIRSFHFILLKKIKNQHLYLELDVELRREQVSDGCLDGLLLLLQSALNLLKTVSFRTPVL